MERIRLCRKQRHMSQQALAELLGIARSTVAMWETGASEPDSDTIRWLAEYFQVTTDYLLGRDAPAAPSTDEALKFALFGGGGEITDEMFDEVKRFAQLVRLREEQARRGQTDSEGEA